MDSLDLISSPKTENYLFLNSDSKNKKLLKCIIIFLIFLFILNIYTIYTIFHLNKKVSFRNMNNKISNIKRKSNQKYMKYINKLNESFNKNNDDKIVEEYIKRQMNFCDYPEIFKNQQFEDLISLTNFSFRNISYQMYVYKKI